MGDEIVFATDADTPLKMLTSTRWAERRVLGSVTYYNDISVTHEDEEYMRRHYEFDNERGHMYFVRTDPEDSEVIEMAFNLSNYQKQLDGTGRNIYQTIFLNDQIRDRWTWDEIDPNKVLIKKWWKQMSHTWKHFFRVVPWVRFLQGRQHTWYAGSWTLFNTHELAISLALLLLNAWALTIPLSTITWLPSNLKSHEDFPWNRSPPPKLVGLALLPTRSIRSQQTRLIVSTIDQDAGHCIHGFLTRLDSINRKTEKK